MSERAEIPPSSRNRSRKRPADVNRLAQSIVEDAVSDEPEEPEAEEPRGRAGGLKGGRARAESLDADKRSEIARRGAIARWSRQTDVEREPGDYL